MVHIVSTRVEVNRHESRGRLIEKNCLHARGVNNKRMNFKRLPSFILSPRVE